MKIGIDASRYNFAQSTGVEWYSFQIINGLIKLILKEKKDKVILYSRKKIWPKNKWLINKVISVRRLWTLVGLTSEIKKNPPDVLFVPSHTLPLCLPKKSVITIHDVAFKVLKNSYSFFQYNYLNWSTKYAVQNATKIIVPSKATADDLVKYFACPKGKIEVVYHGFQKPNVADKDVFKKSDILKIFLEKNTKYLLFVGRLESKKNIVRMIQAFYHFSKKNNDYKLVLAGKRGENFKEIWKTVIELKLTQNVIMPGYITEEEKIYLYKNAQAFLFPSLYEGFGFPILEAFYYKVPVLCSNVSSLPEVGGDCVHYVDPYDVLEIANGIETLIQKSKYVNDLIKKGTERLKLFSWDRACKKTLKILKNG